MCCKDTHFFLKHHAIQNKKCHSVTIFNLVCFTLTKTSPRQDSILCSLVYCMTAITQNLLCLNQVSPDYYILHDVELDLCVSEIPQNDSSHSFPFFMAPFNTYLLTSYILQEVPEISQGYIAQSPCHAKAGQNLSIFI